MTRGPRRERSPLDRWRAASVATWCGGGLAVASLGWWGFLVDEPPARLPAAPAPAAAPGRDEPSPAPLDVAGFAKRLTPAPVVASAPAPAAPQPPSIRLELLGIVRRDGDFAAVLYDPAGDRLHIVGSGERIGDVEVRSVARDAVTLDKAGESRTLALVRKEGR